MLREVKESLFKLMQKLPLMPTGTTCKGLEAGTREWPEVGTGSLG